MNILKIIASILHLGNVRFYESDGICKIENIGTIHVAADVIILTFTLISYNIYSFCCY